MSSPEFENKKLREKIESLMRTVKNQDNKIEYLESVSKENDKTINKLNEELNKIKKVEQDATASLQAALKEVRNLKEELEEQNKLRLQKDDELTRNKKDYNNMIFNLKNDYDNIRLNSETVLNEQKREIEEWRQKLKECQMSLKEKEADISKLTASFNIESQKRETADDEINHVKTLLTEQQDKYEEDIQNSKTEIANLKEQLNYMKKITEGLSSKLDSEKITSKQLNENFENYKKENHKQESEISQLKHELSKAEHNSTEKDKAIKELESTIQKNRDFLYTDSEFDLIVAKIKSLRSENKKLKLENLKLLEENDKLTDDIVCLRKDRKDSEDEHDADDLARENGRLAEINQPLEEEKERLLKEFVSKSYSFN